eukprot:m.24190 g.24190  ORF g.24190 m.24190 type:complete len:1249 (-) comp7584_c0_seq1:100-3846(-)
MMSVNELIRKIAQLFGSSSKKLLAFVVVIYLIRQRQLKAKKRKQKKKGPGDGKKKKKKQAIGKLFSFFMPDVPFADADDGAGSWEILGVLSLCLARIWIMNRQSNLVGELDANMMTRNQAQFWSLFRSTCFVSGVSTLHRAFYKYLEARLGVAWHQKLTSYMHSLYFKDMAYYHVAQVSATSDQGISDPDERITSDVKIVSHQMAKLFCEGVYTATAGVFFSAKLASLYGTQFAVAPYVYLWSSFWLTQKLAPIDFKKILGNLRGQFSEYRRAVSRLIIHQEAIAALKGSTVESQVIATRFDKLMKSTAEYNDISTWHGFVNRMAFRWGLRSFIFMFVLGPHVFYPSVTDLSTLENISKLRGFVGHEFVLFMQSMTAAGISAEMGKKVLKLEGSASRIYELMDSLNEMAIQRRLSSSKKIVTGDIIEFKNVKVRTPTKVTLVEDLNFRLEQGSSILITGHNGAGKSSIFRCLGGLWNIPEGVITKPGSAESGLHQDVFYLPQKPYNVIGSIIDQLTYPERLNAKSLKREELFEILSKVGLGYLATRTEDDIDWEDELSLGEKQRLAMARLIYHKPKYAILDECTSAVSGEMESQLYRICRELRITYITISHRPVLKNYHDQLLTIGVGDKGYHLIDLPRSSFLTAKETQKTKAMEEARTQVQTQIVRDIQEKSITSRIARLLQLSFPGSSLTTPVCGIVGSIVLQAAIGIKMAIWGSQMMSAIFQQDTKIFMNSWLKMTVMNCVSAVVEQFTSHLQRGMRLQMRKSLAKSFHKRLLADNIYYKLTQWDGRIRDVAQRIGDDIDELSQTSTELITALLEPVIKIGFFCVKLQALVGTGATSLLAAYLVFGAMMIQTALPNFKRIAAKEAEKEGVFKRDHHRVHVHSESIAFFGGDSREHEIVDKRFKVVTRLAFQRLQASLGFDLINQAITKETPMLTQWLLRNTYGQTAGSDEDVRKDKGATINGNQLFIYETVMTAFRSMSALLEFLEQFANLSGVITRVAELDEVLTEIEQKDLNISQLVPSSNGSICFDGVDINTPAGDMLAKDVHITVEPTTPLIVTGPNASGKTSFFRVLGGLWPASSGQVLCPCEKDGLPGIKQIFLVPQRMYMVLGTLADQITYPLMLKQTPELQGRLQGLLELVGIGYLSGRQGGWEAEHRWEDILSLGEQQRIGMARLFYHQPKYAVLDECTSAVSIEVEERLYEEARNRGITCITLSQRLCFVQFHKQELRLGAANENRWKHVNLEDE